MNLTPEQQELGRRNFMRVLAGTPALAALGAAAAVKGPVRGGPVRLGFVGLGAQGRVLLEQTDPRYGEVVAVCDINPLPLQKADASLVQTGRQPLKHYADWREMIQKERLEGVVIASPLSTHADLAVGCMEAGLLGEVHHARLVWHRNGNWRRKADLPSPDYSAAQWGYPTFDHLVNWRLYKQYSRGHMAELASHMIAITDWFFGATAESVTGSGGVFRWKDGREVPDHTYVTLDYPGGRTAVFTSIESNAFDNYYEAYYGTRGTLILKGEVEAYLFEEGAPAGDAKATGIAVAPKTGPVGSASESRAADAAGPGSGVGAAAGGGDRLAAYKYQLNGFCGAVRTGAPLACGPERALGSARACIAGFDAIETRTRIEIKA